ncbi:MAG: PAS domain S-box protein [Bacteroidota bacterium]|nr:PAS domain S-box protein [Bacteroidota bacterium]
MKKINSSKDSKELKANLESDLRFRELANSLPLVVWTASPDGNLTFISQQWEEEYGNPIAESLGTGWANCVHADDIANAASAWAFSLESGTNYETEFRVQHKNDGYHWILVRAKPIRTEKGTIISWTGSNTDIQDKKLNEKALKESAEQFMSLGNSIPNLAWMADAEGWIYWYNNKWYEYTGTKPEDMEGWGWQSVHDPNELPHVLERWQSSIANGEPFEMVFPLKGADGKFRHFLTRVLPVLNSEGRITHWFGTNTDVTEQKLTENRLKENEQNLRNTIIQAPVAMCILKGPDYVVDLANARMIQLWGKSPEEVLDKPILESLPEVKEQGFDVLLEGVYTTGKTYSAEGVPATLTRNGKPTTTYVNFVFEAYRELDGTISGILAVAIDVTAEVIARQKIEEVVADRTKDLADVNDNLKKSNAELAQFAYIASHDLQEPLRKISTFSELLEKSMGSEWDAQAKNYLSKIRNSSKRMNTLIKDILAYSELEKDSEHFAQVDLNKTADDILADYEVLVEQKKATITFENLPILEAIPLQMSQLFGNMLGNALKFTKPDTKPVILVSSTPLDKTEIENNSGLDPTKEYIRLRFSDNGIGFKKEYAEQIFNIFQRLHRRTEFDGTGIGLAICKKIALNHHGLISADGSLENGAVFNVILPVHQTS